MEWSIGEIRQIDGEWYQCIESYFSCEGCDFKNTSKCSHEGVECSFPVRQDYISVIFKKLEKIGEPYDDCGTILQRFKIYTNVTNANTKGLELHIYSNDTIGIEIKQNKEDMDENKLNLKPFDIQKAREGKPVCTRDRKKARIICFDKGGIYPVIALVQEEGSETCHFYEKDGKCADSGNGHDLLMLSEKKEGWANVYDDTPIYDTKEEALNRRSKIRGYIDTVKVSWEE